MLKKLFESVLKVAERLIIPEQVPFSEVPDSLSPLEVSEHLNAAGTDVEKLRARLYATASELAKQQRLKGKPVPTYLQQVIDASGPSDKTPSDLKMALDKTKPLICIPDGTFQVDGRYHEYDE